MTAKLVPKRLADALRSASNTFTEDRQLKREAARHIERLEALLRDGLGKKHNEEYRALVERVLEV